ETPMRPCEPMLSLVAALVVAFIAPGATLAQAPPVGPVDAEQVISSIERGVDYLKREQNPRGNWNDQLAFPGGVSALCTLALLNSGIEPSDPVVEKALTYLRRAKLEKTYTVTLQTMVLCAA